MKYFVSFVIAVVAAAVVAGFFVVGSPQEERLRQFDNQRVQHLQYIQSEIINYWTGKEKLPENLASLKDDIRGISIPRDPQTGAEYEYEVKGPLTFSLCATFVRSNQGQANGVFSKPAYYGPYGPAPMSEPENWDHATGRVCFDRTIDKDFYKPMKR